MKLAALQRRFQAEMLPSGAGDAAFLPAAAWRGFPVYVHAYRATLRAALADCFERVHAWLGDDLFEAAVTAQIAAEPPASWTLADYGAGFPATLARLHPQDAEIAELAWLDWSLRRAFAAANAAPLAPADLAAVDWATAGLRFHPSLALHAIATNSPAIWSAIAAGETPPPLATLGDALWLRVWRQGLTPTFRTIAADEAAALDALGRGDSFATMCASLPGDEVDAAARAGALLAAWIADGLIVEAAHA